MTDEAYFGLALLPILALWAWTLVHRVDKTNPRRDWVAERHRKISHNGLKSRMGVR